jgi:GH24 family phage-related lysozyme (muramidase)
MASVADSQRFVDYLISAEGSKAEVYTDKAGHPTVGIGHKLREGETFDKPLKMGEQIQLLRKDIKEAEGKVIRHVGQDVYKDLSPQQKEMLVDYAFNVKGGLETFPKFTQAVIAGDLETARNEHTRYATTPDGEKVELGRNQLFANTYLAGDFTAGVRTASAPAKGTPATPKDRYQALLERRAKRKQMEDRLPKTLKFGPLDTGIPLDKDVAAFLVGMGHGMTDTIRGVQQIFGVAEDKLAEDQRLVRELYASTRGGSATAGQIVGLMADPVALAVPVTRGKGLWNTLKAGTAIGGTFGALGYVDKDAGQTRYGNLAFGMAAGLTLSPVLHGVNKAADSVRAYGQKKAANVMLDNIELQTARYVKLGLPQDVAYDSAMVKLGFTEDMRAAAVLAAGRKPKIAGPKTAAEMIRMHTDFETRLSKAPTTAVGRAMEDFITPITTRIQRMSSPIYNRLKKHDMRNQLRSSELFTKTDPFLNTVRKIDKTEDGATLHKALFSGDRETTISILKKHGGKQAIKEYAVVRKVLNQLHKDLDEVGYKLPKIEEYFPRIVKNIKEVSNLQHDRLSKALRKARQANKGRRLTDAQVARVMDTILVRDSNRTFAQTSGSLRKRAITQVDDRLLEHYHSPAEALHTYLRSTIADIERRRLFKAYGYKPDPKKGLDVSGGDLDDSIGWLVEQARKRGEISKQDQNDLIEILKVRFGQGEATASSGVQAAKNLTYLVTLGNPVAAATQLGDIVFSAQKYGTFRSLRAAFDVVKDQARELVGKERKVGEILRKEDLGLMDAMEEFVSSGNTKRWLDNALSWSGFKRVDRIGKETVMNSALRKAHKMMQTEKGRDAFRAKWAPYFEDEVGDLMSGIAGKKLNENVKLFLWHELTNIQPVALSEMPLKYLEFPDGRLLYMLRTFTIKQLDFMRREIFSEARRGNHYQFAKKFAQFGMLFVLANSGIDELKDFMQGREVDFEDHLIDNIWTLAGVNKYTMDKAGQQGPISAAIDFVAPPLTVFDDLYRGIDDPKRLWNLMPIGGRMIKGWSSSERDNYYESLDLGKFNPSELE